MVAEVVVMNNKSQARLAVDSHAMTKLCGL